MASIRKRRQAPSQAMNLDSLVDIVSNNVGILVILAAFMALFALINPRTQSQPAATPREQTPQKLLVPWSHPTNKHHVFLTVQENRIHFFDLRQFFRDLADTESDGPPTPVTVSQPGLDVRFFPVTNQVYCLEFQPEAGYGENWLQAQRPRSRWQEVLSTYPAERYVYYFWVTGDSFELFRQLRDSLWERNYEVGWKPTQQDQPLEVCNGFEGSTTFQPQ